MGWQVGIYSKSNWWSKADLTMCEGAPFRFNNYMTRMRFEGIFFSLCYTVRKDVGYNDGLLHMRQM